MTLSNAGNGDLTLNGFNITGAFTATDDCPATLAPNASCTVQITFSPDAIGNYSGVLSLDSDAPGAPATVTLSGTGTSGHRGHGHRRRWRGNHIACGRHGRRRPNANLHRDACRRLQHLEREWLRRKFERQHLHDCADFGKLLHYRRIRGGGDGERQGWGRVHGLPRLGWLADHVALAVFPPRFRGGVALVLALPCMAQAGDFNPWYGGVRLGNARTDVSSADVNNRLNDLGYDVSAQVEDSSRTAWGAFGGWRVSQHFGTQFGYTDLGNVDTVFTGDALDIEAFLRDASRLQPRSASGFDLNLVGRYPLGKRFEIAAQLGAFAWNADYTVSNASGDFLKREDNGLDLTYGAGLEYGLDGGLAFTGGWTRYKVDSESIDFLGVGLQYRWH